MEQQDGLIYAFALDGKGGGREMGWEGVRTWQPGQGTLWVHLDYREERALAWLKEDSGLDPLTAESLIEDETRPRLVSSGEALLVILRGVNFNPGADPEDMVALRMLLEPKRVISMRHRKVMAVGDVAESIREAKGPQDAGDFLVMVCDRMADRMAEVVSDIDTAADDMEDAVLEARSSELRPQIGRLRRQSIAMRRYLAPQRDVLARVQNERTPVLDDMNRLHLRESAERTARFVEDMDAARDRAAVTLEELNNRLSEQMNKTMYVLSLVAAVFLPLGFVTGLLGINVGGIPGADYHWAFTIVTFGLGGVAGLLLAIFKRLHWL